MVALASSFVVPLDLAPEAAVDLMLRAGAAGAVLDSTLDPGREEALAKLLVAKGLPLVAMQAPTPRTPASRASLVSSDREEAQAALAALEETLRRAGERGCTRLLVKLGLVRELEADWRPARDRYLRGELDERWGRRLGLRAEAASARALDVARRALDRLAGRADRAGVEILIMNPRRFVEAPTPRGLDALLADLRGAPIAPAFDAAAAHLSDDMCIWPAELTLASYAARARLASLGDAAGAVGGLVPGMGVLPLHAWATRLPQSCERAFFPSALLSEAEVARSLEDGALFVRG